MTNFGKGAVWIPTSEIEGRLGGSSVTTNPHLKIVKRDLSKFADKFQLAVREHADLRLAAILNYTEVLFALSNEGRIKIIGTHSNGSYLWAPKLSAERRR